MAGEGRLDAVVLAMAGLNRAGLAEPYGQYLHPLDPEQIIPAAGQGLLALQAMAHRADVAQVLACIEDAESRAALEAERAVLRGLEAGCQSCLAIHIGRAGGRWAGRAMVARPDGRDMIRLSCEAASSATAGLDLLSRLIEGGADRLLAQP